jgi:hypothetical protein
MTVDIWIRDYNPPRCFQKKISGRSKHNVCYQFNKTTDSTISKLSHVPNHADFQFLTVTTSQRHVCAFIHDTIQKESATNHPSNITCSPVNNVKGTKALDPVS